MKLRFYKEETGFWYADLPDYIAAGGKKEDCQMVAGADLWLDILVNGKRNDITLEVSKERGDNVLRLIFKGYDGTDCDLMNFGGATYRPGEIRGVDYSHHTIWLCPVTLFVFGEYPAAIYYNIVED